MRQRNRPERESESICRDSATRPAALFHSRRALVGQLAYLLSGGQSQILGYNLAVVPQDDVYFREKKSLRFAEFFDFVCQSNQQSPAEVGFLLHRFCHFHSVFQCNLNASVWCCHFAEVDTQAKLLRVLQELRPELIEDLDLDIAAILDFAAAGKQFGGGVGSRV